jgi:fatty-acyl-CoA synthase
MMADELDRLDGKTRAIAPTPTGDSLPRRFSDFATLGEALDYAAQGARGLNFHDPRGNLRRAYTFAELREDALQAAYRLIAAGAAPGDRIALVAETSPEFAALFFGAVYAGAWPVPLPLPTSFGGRDSYVEQLRVQLGSCDPKLLIYPPELSEMAHQAAELGGVEDIDWDTLAGREAPEAALPQAAAEDIAYLQ